MVSNIWPESIFESSQLFFGVSVIRGASNVQYQLNTNWTVEKDGVWGRWDALTLG